MSSFGSQYRKRLAELRKAGADVPKIIDEVAEIATIEAVNTAQQNTPPNAHASIAGTKTRTGTLARSWTRDSITTPNHGTTYLNNFAQNDRGTPYASFVNDGHRLDMHYVPGLIINEGLFERVDPSEGGMMVGTKTDYIKGIYMKEKAIGKYRDTVRKELDRRVKERFER
jgi:hypothetical protein